MSRESLDRLWPHASFDPSGHSEMAQSVPVEALYPECVEERQEPPLDQIIVPNVFTFSIGKNQIVRL
jgi:hypothetical protein